MMIKSFSEMLRIETFKGRYDYLRLGGKVGDETFGFDRWLNQLLYKSRKWKDLRDRIIIRDKACDLALDGYEINNRVVIHHINPITIDDVESDNQNIYNTDNLVCVSYLTHAAIHYGDESLLPHPLVIRRPNDTKLWR